ncbi:MAG: serine/threonine protein kinase, partial [Planctomycetota bacterium]
MPEQPDPHGDATHIPEPAAPATVNLPAPLEGHDEPTVTPTDRSTPSAPTTSAADLESGRQARSFGDYELLGEIARGGMGVVYRARETRSGRLVALKMMLADSALDSVYVQRFILEARATGELSHPGIVAIHSWGQHEGQLFYTMDYVPGFPLSRILKRRPLPVPRAVRYLLGIARAVAAAHAQGIVHRDLKPSNVVIDPTDQPRVLDFGLAKRHRSAAASRQETAVEVTAVDDVVDVLPAEAPPVFPSSPPPRSPTTPYATEKGTVLGTPAYMAPEQARGEHSSVGPAADVHALGAMFFELLTGRPPFEGATMMDTLIDVMEKKPASLRLLNRSIPSSIAAVCERCLA